MVPFSFYSDGGVKTAHAQRSGAGAIGGCIGQLIAGAISSYFSTSVPVNPGSLNVKECIDGAVKALGNKMKQEVINSTLEWARTGFQGDPTFLVNEKRYLREAANEEALAFIDGFSNAAAQNTVGSFGPAVQRALIEDERRVVADTLRCSLCEEYNEDAFYEDFTGGWGAWFKAAEPGSNPFGGYLLASEQVTRKKTEAEEKILRDAERGDGFLSLRTCAERVTVPSDGRPGSGSSYCKRYETETPGQTIANTVQHSLGSDIRELELADEMNEVFSAVISGLINRVALDGLRGRGSGGGDSPGRITGTSGSDGDTTSTEDFIDSLTPGRTAQTDTRRATPSGIPEGTGQGLTGGAVIVEEVSNISSAEAVNLSDESFVDWVYFGLSSNFGTDVERKNIPTPQLVQSSLNTSSLNAISTAPDVGFTFSWSDGHPQREGSSESEGLGINTEGAQVDFPITGGDREQELTLYLGATRANGQLRIGFADSPEDEVVINIESPNTDTGRIITLRHNLPSNETLIVSYRAEELFPLTDGGSPVPGSAMVGLYAATLEESRTLYPPENPTLVKSVDGVQTVVLSGGDPISRTGSETFSGLFGQSWWPQSANATVSIGSTQYLSLPFRTEEDFSGNGRVIVSQNIDSGSSDSILAIAFSKYPGDFRSMYETDRQNDRNCLAAYHYQEPSSDGGIFGSIGNLFNRAQLHWYIAIPPVVNGTPVESACQLKPNTRYYLNILCRDGGSCSDIDIQTADPGGSQQGGERLHVQTQ